MNIGHTALEYGVGIINLNMILIKFPSFFKRDPRRNNKCTIFGIMKIT